MDTSSASSPGFNKQSPQISTGGSISRRVSAPSHQLTLVPQQFSYARCRTLFVINVTIFLRSGPFPILFLSPRVVRGRPSPVFNFQYHPMPPPRKQQRLGNDALSFPTYMARSSSITGRTGNLSSTPVSINSRIDQGKQESSTTLRQGLGWGLGAYS